MQPGDKVKIQKVPERVMDIGANFEELLLPPETVFTMTQ
jgi:hypothetical protein